MKRITVAALAGLLLLAPIPAAAGENADYSGSQARYLKAATQYQETADELEYQKAEMRPDQQTIVGGLVDVYRDLADIKVALADATGDQDWAREEQLETRYYALKKEEERLWDDLEATKR